ncbi:AAA family ATPase [Paraburkholderia sp. CI3]|uniref:AAA family ATPase n=1 Tax=Paraburkholderia sp. CI3 TaxID=2991060 RepID=UPI003D1BD45D
MGTVRNLSIRVPWHDDAWNGNVCRDPLGNSSCIAVKVVADGRKDAFEAQAAGESFNSLAPDTLPPCLRSSGSFLSPHAHVFESVMSYSRWSQDHKHIKPRSIHVPAWGALTIPYRWMLKESGFSLAEELGLDCSREQEPGKPDWLENTSWIQGLDNQTAMLEAFANPLVENESLVLFYATRTPLSDSERRVLLGAALLSKKHQLQEYSYAGAGPDALRTMVWERPVQHTLRQGRDGHFSGGFVMPYHALLRHCADHPEIDPADFVAYAPDDVRIQFSYGSEHVTHGAAAAALMSARHALERIADLLEGPWETYIEWIDARLSELWKMNGPAPGLGPVLSAFHNGFSGTLFAIALSDELPVNADPWPAIDEIFSGSRQAPAGSPAVTGMLRKRWTHEKSKHFRLDLLKLLSRFELTREQAKRALEKDAEEIVHNPYLLFERDRTEGDPIAYATIDRGLLPGKEVAAAHPLPACCNPDLGEYDNEHRLRAACVELLETSTARGHTLLPASELAHYADELDVVQPVPLDAETIEICSGSFEPVVKVSGQGKNASVQLERYVATGALLSTAVRERLQNKPQTIEVDWRGLVDKTFGAAAPDNVDEHQARTEKALALERIAANRLSVLIGPAGTGKTTVLKFLLSRADIVGSRVQLLAPTGKARVRLGKETQQLGTVQTVAQFLLESRYDADTGRYFINKDAPKVTATTCVVDESSMLTEDMLAAIVDALPGNCRLILVGDPYQLPPIGAGCPFVDIIEFLRRSGYGEAVAELQTPRRTRQDGTNVPVLSRSDVQLAAIFSGRNLPPGEDEIVSGVLEGKDDEHVRFRRFEGMSELPELIESVLTEDLQCSRANLTAALELSMGATRDQKGYLNFDAGCSKGVAGWQILSVNRNGPGGALFLNRRIKEGLRAGRLSDTLNSRKTPYFKEWWRYPKPGGSEQIVYGDKVICVRNHRRKSYVYGGSTNASAELLANGEIGLVTGQRSWGKRASRFIHVEFEDRGDRNFSFSGRDFSEDGQPKLELAYAITVHKAQGSEFDTVILVLPAHSRLVSREMLYTALTRQSKRIWILHQGPFENFLALRHHVFSDISGRFTNLLSAFDFRAATPPANVPPGLKSAQRRFLTDKLIHRTLRGDMVSAKNEVVIANILHGFEKDGLLRYEVEPMLPFSEGRGRWADFRIESQGDIWYWEHCGLLSDDNYRKRWQRKLALYAANGFSEYSETNPGGRLIVTRDGPEEGLDSVHIDALARRAFLK